MELIDFKQGIICKTPDEINTVADVLEGYGYKPKHNKRFISSYMCVARAVVPNDETMIYSWGDAEDNGDYLPAKKFLELSVRYKKPKLRIVCGDGKEANEVLNKLMSLGYSTTSVHPIPLCSPTDKNGFCFYIFPKKKYWRVRKDIDGYCDEKIHTFRAKDYLYNNIKDFATLKIRCRDGFEFHDVIKKISEDHEWVRTIPFGDSYTITPSDNDWYEEVVVYVLPKKRVDWGFVKNEKHRTDVVVDANICTAKQYLEIARKLHEKKIKCDDIIWCDTESSLHDFVGKLKSIGYTKLDEYKKEPNPEVFAVVTKGNAMRAYAMRKGSPLLDSLKPKRTFENDNKFYTYIGEIKIRSAGKTVAVISERNHKIGVAKCSEDDEYSLAFGIGLALARLFGDEAKDIVSAIEYERKIHVGDTVKYSRTGKIVYCVPEVIKVLRRALTESKICGDERDSILTRFEFGEPRGDDTDYIVLAQDSCGYYVITYKTNKDLSPVFMTQGDRLTKKGC